MGVLKNHRYGVDSGTFETGSTLDSCSAEDDERVAALVRLSDAATLRLAVVGEPSTEPQRPGTGPRIAPSSPSDCRLETACAILPLRPGTGSPCPRAVRNATVITKGTNHQSRPARQSDDPDPTGPGS